MKRISKLLVKGIENTIKKESNSVCCIIGYQPYMPDSVRKYKGGKLNDEEQNGKLDR